MTEETKKPYQFKVGDRGKTKEGKVYEVVAIVPDALEDERLVIALGDAGDGQKRIRGRTMEGHLWADGRRTGADLLLPSVFVYDVHYEFVRESMEDGFAVTRSYKNLDVATRRYKFYLAATEHYKNVTLTPREVNQE